jgi:hypothetical protein
MRKEREVIRNRAEKKPLIHQIIQHIVDGDASPLKPGDGVTKKMVQDLYHLDIETLKFLRKAHKAAEENHPQG